MRRESDVMAGEVVIDSPRARIELPASMGFGSQFDIDEIDVPLIEAPVYAKPGEIVVWLMRQRSDGRWAQVRKLYGDESVTVVNSKARMSWDAKSRSGTYQRLQPLRWVVNTGRVG